MKKNKNNLEKEEKLKIIGEVIENLPNCNFKVKLENDKIITCYLSGKLRINNIMIVPGDKVEVEISVFDLTKGIIKWRFKD